MLIFNFHAVVPAASRRVMRARVVLFALCSVFVLGSGELSRGDDSKGAADARRTSTKIAAEIQAAMNGLPKYRMVNQVDPKAGQFMSREMGPALQRLVDLFTEFEKVDPARAAGLRAEKCHALVRLALWGNGDALKSLTDSSKSNVPSDALFGKVGLLMYRWWNSADAATQKDVVSEFAPLAKASPTDDILFHAALQMARYRAASEDVANSLRDIVEQDLTGPGAQRYHHQAYKIGRPFSITVKGIDGRSVSTADWRGKVVMIDMWATWCPPCVATVPKLVELYQSDHPKGLEILGISHDSSLSALKEFLASHPGMVWPESFDPSAQDGSSALSPQLGIHGVPTTFIIDRNGILRELETGFLDHELISQLLDEPVKPHAPLGASGKTDAAPQPVVKPEVASQTQTADPEEKQADAILSLANSYIVNKRPDRAVEKLNQLVEKYPNTKAAQKAKELLAQLNKQ